MKRQLILHLFLMSLAVVAFGATTTADGVYRFGAHGDTVAALPANTGPKRRANQVVIVSPGGIASYVIHAGTTTAGTKLFEHYLTRDDSGTTVSSGTTFTLSLNRSFPIPPTGMLLQTSDTSSTLGVYVYTREDNTE